MPVCLDVAAEGQKDPTCKLYAEEYLTTVHAFHPFFVTPFGLVCNHIKQWSPTLDLQMVLDYNSQKASPPPLVARISGNHQGQFQDQ